MTQAERELHNQLMQVKEQYRVMLEQALADNEPQLMAMLQVTPALTINLHLEAHPQQTPKTN